MRADVSDQSGRSRFLTHHCCIRRAQKQPGEQHMLCLHKCHAHSLTHPAHTHPAHTHTLGTHLLRAQVAKTYAEVCVLPLCDVNECPPVLFRELIQVFRQRYLIYSGGSVRVRSLLPLRGVCAVILGP